MVFRVIILFFSVSFFSVVAAEKDYDSLIKYYTKNPSDFDYEVLLSAYVTSERLIGLEDFYYFLNSNKKKISLDESKCILPLRVLKKHLKSNYLSIAAHYHLMRCYEGRNQKKLADNQSLILQKFFEEMYRGKDGSDQGSAIYYSTYSDLYVLTYLSGHEFLDSYIELSYNGGNYYNVVLAKEKDGQDIKKLYFTNNRIISAYLKKLSLSVGPKMFLSEATAYLMYTDYLGREAYSARGDYYSDARFAYPDLKKAESNYKLAAKQGSFYAKTRLAYFYLKNKGLMSGYEEIVDLLLPGLEVGFLESEFAMAALYYMGYGVEKNREAYGLLVSDLQRQLGPAEANIRLSEFLMNIFDAEEAKSIVYTLLSGVTKESDVAKIKLGKLYNDGYGGVKKTKKARALFDEVAKGGNSSGYYWLGRSYEDKEQNHKLALSYYMKAAQSGFAQAQAKVCWAYHLGLNVKPNQKEAVRWCDKGANQGDPLSQFYLGVLVGVGYESEFGSSTQYRLSLYEAAAHRGLDDAQLALAAIYYSVFGYYQWESMFWFWKAAEQGNVGAQYELGNMMLAKRKSVDNAIFWLQSAAKQGHINAMLRLGKLYELGVHVDQSRAKAKEWYQKALDLGSDIAKTRLKALQSNEKIPFATLIGVGIYDVETSSSDEPTDILSGHLTGKVDVKKGNFSLINRTNAVPVRLGTSVYIHYKLDGMPKGKYKVKMIFKHNEYADENGVKTTGYTLEEKFKFGPDGVYDDFGWFFVQPYEILAGDWKLSMFYKEKLIFEESFTTYLTE